jgi:hypothetical protein
MLVPFGLALALFALKMLTALLALIALPYNEFSLE